MLIITRTTQPNTPLLPALSFSGGNGGTRGRAVPPPRAPCWPWGPAPPLSAQGVLGRAAGCVLERDVTVGATWLQYFCRVRLFSSAVGHKSARQQAGGGSWSPQSGPGPPPPGLFAPSLPANLRAGRAGAARGIPVAWGRALALGGQVLAPLQVLGGGEPGAPGAAVWVGNGARSCGCWAGGPRHSSRREGQDQQGGGERLFAPPHHLRDVPKVLSDPAACAPGVHP